MLDSVNHSHWSVLRIFCTGLVLATLGNISVIPGLQWSRAVQAGPPELLQGGTAILRQSESQKAAQATGAPTAEATPPASPAANLTDAEQIARLRRGLDADQARLSQLKTTLADPESEYQQAEREFQQLDSELQKQKAQHQKLIDADDQPAAEKLAVAIAELEKKRGLSRERFDLAITTRKTIQEQVANLEQKLQRDTQALDKLTGNTPAPAVVADPVAPPATVSETAPPAAPVATPAVTSGMLPGMPQTAPSPAATTPATAEAASPEAVVSQEILAAQKVADSKKKLASEAEEQRLSVSERLETLDKSIELEQKLFAAAREKSNLAYETHKALEQEFNRLSATGGEPAQLADLAAKVREATTRFGAARREVSERTDHLQELHAERAGLQAEQLSAETLARASLEDLQRAEAKVTQLRNPLTVRNIVQWLFDHGPRLIAILIGIFVSHWLVRIGSRRLIKIMSQTGAVGTELEREDRARTLVGVFQNALSLVVVIGGILMICDELGLAVAPLMGGAAVLGLAVAFGAQNLIRDYFYGFVILLENQYKLNDVLRIGEISGQVERITLRVTVLRDLQGQVHFIPNGKIDSVTNMTHGWSRAVLEIAVAYQSDIDHVMEVLLDLAEEMRRDARYAAHIIDDPEMLGVEGFGEGGVLLKFVVKTRPLKQWIVKRELLRRIKLKFDELGIQIPLQQRIVHMRYSGEPALASDLESDTLLR